MRPPSLPGPVPITWGHASPGTQLRFSGGPQGRAFSTTVHLVARHRFGPDLSGKTRPQNPVTGRDLGQMPDRGVAADATGFMTLPPIHGVSLLTTRLRGPPIRGCGQGASTGPSGSGIGDQGQIVWGFRPNFGGVGQLRPSKPRVAGSSPAGRAISFPAHHLAASAPCWARNGEASPFCRQRYGPTDRPLSI